MHYYICIDDTDNKDTKGTGWLAERACGEMTKLGLAEFSAISRHQLFVHEDVPYTSHNSSMCMEFDSGDDPAEIVRYMQRFLEENGAPGSDPGLCVVPAALASEYKERLISFGRDAKCKVLNKGLAYGLAEEISVHLTEHGGTGDGVVGALAGVGLRMAGDDGRYRGWFHLGPEGVPMPAGEIAEQCGAARVLDEDGKPLASDCPVLLQEKIKLVRRMSSPVLMARSANGNGTMELLPKIEIKAY